MDSKSAKAFSAQSTPPIEYVFSSLSPLNSDLLLNGLPRYRIQAQGHMQWDIDITDLQRNQVIASIRKKALSQGTVLFPGKNAGMPYKRSNWLIQSTKRPTSQCVNRTMSACFCILRHVLCSTTWTITNHRGVFAWRVRPHEENGTGWLSPFMRLVVRQWL